MSILQEKWWVVVKNWWRKLGEYRVTSYFCQSNTFSIYIFIHLELLHTLYGSSMSIIQKKWRQTVKNSWNETVSTIVTLVTLWRDVTGSGCCQGLFNSTFIYSTFFYTDNIFRYYFILLWWLRVPNNLFDLQVEFFSCLSFFFSSTN